MLVDPNRYEPYRLLLEKNGTAPELGRSRWDVWFRAVDTRLDRPVTLRALRSEFVEDRTAQSAFLLGMKRAARLTSPGIARLLHVEDAERPSFAILEPMPPRMLRDLLADGKTFSWEESLALLEQVCMALADIEANGLVLLGLGPEAIGLDDSSEAHITIKLIPPSLVGKGERATEGATADAAPELHDNTPLDIRASIFSVGKLLETMMGVRAADLADLPADPALAPPEIRALFEVLLRDERERRIPSTSALLDLLAKCRQSLEPPPVTSSHLPEPTPQIEPAAEESPPGNLHDRFQIIERLESASGNFFEATDRTSQKRVVLRLFDSDDNQDTTRQLIEEGRAVRRHPHPNLFEAVAADPGEERPFTAYEKPRGLSVLELLRKRRQLEMDEAFPLLRQIGAAVDHARTINLPDLDLRPPAIRLSLDAGNQHEASPTGQTGFLQFQLKVGPTGAYPLSTTGKPMQGDLLFRFGVTAYEMLGGSPRAISSGKRGFPPIAGLSASENAALKRILSPRADHSYPTAKAFLADLRQPTTALAGRPTPLPPELEPYSTRPAIHGDTPPPTNPGHNEPATANAIRPRHPLVGIWIGLLSALGLAAVAAALFLISPAGDPWLERFLPGITKPNRESAPRETNPSAPPGAPPEATPEPNPTLPLPTPEPNPSPASEETLEIPRFQPRVPTIPTPENPDQP